MHPPPIKPFEQRLELGRAEPHDAIVDRWPAKLSVFQSLRHKHDAGAVPEDQLHPVGPLRAEHVHHTGERIGAHGFAHQRCQPLRSFPQVDRLRRHQNPDIARRPDHASAAGDLRGGLKNPQTGRFDAAAFGPAAAQVFDRIMQMTDNAGATDEHRALNYLCVRYPAIYARAAQSFAQDFSLSAVDVRPSTLSGTRRIVDVIFSYTNRNTDYTEKYFVRVDVTEEFPFLMTKLSPYYDR
jgi:hypothetical protein